MIVHPRHRRTATAFILALLAVPAAPSRADPPQPIVVTLKEHRFAPAEIRFTANAPALIEIRNEDATVEEFDCRSPRIEKIIAGGRSAQVRLPPLAPGHYPCTGEYHAGTAQSVLIAE